MKPVLALLTAAALLAACSDTRPFGGVAVGVGAGGVAVSPSLGVRSGGTSLVVSP